MPARVFVQILTWLIHMALSCITDRLVTFASGFSFTTTYVIKFFMPQCLCVLLSYKIEIQLFSVGLMACRMPKKIL